MTIPQDKNTSIEPVFPDFGWIPLSSAFERCEEFLKLNRAASWSLIKKACENGKLQIRGKAAEDDTLLPLRPEWISRIAKWGASRSSYKADDGSVVYESQGPNDLPSLDGFNIIWLKRNKDIPAQLFSAEVNEDDLSAVIRSTKLQNPHIFDTPEPIPQRTRTTKPAYKVNDLASKLRTFSPLPEHATQELRRELGGCDAKTLRKAIKKVRDELKGK